MAFRQITHLLPIWPEYLITRDLPDFKSYLRLNKIYQNGSIFFNSDQTLEGGQDEVASVLGLAELSQKMAGELKERLVSDKKGVQLEGVKRTKIDTPAEGGLREIVAHKVGGDGSGSNGAGMINVAILFG